MEKPFGERFVETKYREKQTRQIAQKIQIAQKTLGGKSVFRKLDSTNFFNTLHKALLSHCYLDKKKRDGASAQFSNTNELVCFEFHLR